MPQVNYLAVVLAALSAFVLGGLWYSLLFAKPWAALTGQSDETLKSALLPFFSTKEQGTGLGLALAREIVEAHRGKLSIARRDGGGVEVACWLPGRSSLARRRTQSLTLTGR